MKISNKNWIKPSNHNENELTTGELKIIVDQKNLTQNINIWSKKVEDSIIASSIPLANWFLHSWWRLLYEPIPTTNTRQSINVEWRMAHEIGAANHGYVWPKIAFVSDLKHIAISAHSYREENQSVQYINGLTTPYLISLETFQQNISSFIEETINRIDSQKVSSTSIHELWEIIQEETASPELKSLRKIEAMMGFDPEEADEKLIKIALEKQAIIGKTSFDEIIPSYGNFSNKKLEDIDNFFKARGILGTPQISLKQRSTDSIPWRRAKEDVSKLREQIGNYNNPLGMDKLLDIIGIAQSDEKIWGQEIISKQISIGRPKSNENSFQFIPRKIHHHGKRFEIARLLGDYLGYSNGDWLVNSDTHTDRQKYQRAFAAELLCPVNGLLEWMDNDFSDDVIEAAAEHYDVSPRIVESVLANNGIIEIDNNDALGYSFSHYEVGAS